MKYFITILLALATTITHADEDASSSYQGAARYVKCPSNTVPYDASMAVESLTNTYIHNVGEFFYLVFEPTSMSNSFVTVDTGNVTTLGVTNANTVWKTNHAYFRLRYMPDCEDQHSQNWDALETLSTATFTGGGFTGTNNPETVSNLEFAQIGAGDSGLEVFGYFLNGVSRGTELDPGLRASLFQGTTFQAYRRPPLNLHVPRLKFDDFNPLKPVSLISSNVPGSFAWIYTNNGSSISSRSNWVLATTATHDSNGIASVTVSNWSLPSSGAYFLLETTNSP